MPKCSFVLPIVCDLLRLVGNTCDLGEVLFWEHILYIFRFVFIRYYYYFFKLIKYGAINQVKALISVCLVDALNNSYHFNPLQKY